MREGTCSHVRDLRHAASSSSIERPLTTRSILRTRAISAGVAHIVTDRSPRVFAGAGALRSLEASPGSADVPRFLATGGGARRFFAATGGGADLSADSPAVLKLGADVFRREDRSLVGTTGLRERKRMISVGQREG